MKEDRRVQRTKQLLTSSLIALIAERGYDSITVQNIIDHANIGRSTFYAHYRDKEDLLLQGFEVLVDVLICKVEQPLRSDGKRQHFITALPLFEHTHENHRLYKAMVGEHGMDVVRKFIHQSLCQRITEEIDRQMVERNSPAVPANIIANHIAGSLLTLLTWWHDNDMPHSPETMNEIFQILTMPGILAALEPSGHNRDAT